MGKKRHLKRPSGTMDLPPQAPSPYETLGVPADASFAEIRKAYLAKVRISTPETDPEGFKAVRKAYAELEDAGRRRKLDLALFRTESGLLSGKLEASGEGDALELLRRRVFGLLLSSTDLYAKDFSADFGDLERAVGELR